MSKQPLSLAMSQIIAHDAPLLSPTDSNWEPLFSPSNDNFTYAYYNIPPEPTHSVNTNTTTLDDPLSAASMLKTRVPAQDLCVPTHQLFDFPEAIPQTPPTRSSSISADLISSSANITDDPSSGSKRSASPAPSATKKRAVGERISSKDFIPPDVSGLSKREARLVKNRAAAFLSRQRKREEFECMEVRVAELEQENARLLALTQCGSSQPSQSSSSTADNHLLSEVEQLKAQLAAARERELSLSAQLANSTSTVLPNVKVEASDHNPLHTLAAASPRSSISNSVPSPHKSGASFGLMVLLCALPSLLSMRMQSTAPTSFSIPNPFPSSSNSYDYNSFLPSEYDWSKATGAGNSMMDLDADHHSLDYPPHHSHHHHNRRKQLEFTTASEDDASELGSLGDLDISFDTSPTDDGKIRVRIHPSLSSSSSSRSGSPGLSSSSSQHDMSAPVTPSSPTSSSSLAMWSGVSAAESSLQSTFASQFTALSAYSSSHSSLSSSSSSSSASSSSSSPPHSSISSSPSDPFLGVPFSSDGSISSMKYGMMDMDERGMETNYDYSYNLGMGDDGFGVLPPSAHSGLGAGKGEKKRVRIALKSLPSVGGEGGEWEVQIC